MYISFSITPHVQRLSYSYTDGYATSPRGVKSHRGKKKKRWTRTEKEGTEKRKGQLDEELRQCQLSVSPAGPASSP
jgi:hypothetical protein